MSGDYREQVWGESDPWAESAPPQPTHSSPALLSPAFSPAYPPEEEDSPFADPQPALSTLSPSPSPSASPYPAATAPAPAPALPTSRGNKLESFPEPHSSPSPAAYVRFSPSVLSVSVTNPEKHGEGSVDAYISYEVITQTSLETFSSKESQVRRRYQDFVWLKGELDRDYPIAIVPPLPEKHRLDYLDRFSPLFIEKRQAALQRFIDRIVSHPLLQKSDLLRHFLEAKPATLETLKQSRKGSAMTDLGDSLMNAFSKIKFPDSRFTSLAESNQKFQDNLSNLERLHHRTSKRHVDMCEDLVNLGGVFNLLSTEEGVGPGFRKIGQVTDGTSAHLKEMSDYLDQDFLGRIRDYWLYCESIKRALKHRDQQQAEFEELSTTLEAKLGEREASANPQSKSLMSSILSSDPQKLQATIDELQKAVSESSEETKIASDQMLREMEYFTQSKTEDFKVILKEYATHRLKFAQKMLDQWQEVLPLVEELQVD